MTPALDAIELTTLTGGTTTFGALAGPVTLVVNVASQCGFTPQYAGLEQLWRTYRDRGLVVIGVPTNQFLQERGDEADIAEFCQVNYGVTFPLMARVRVNGRKRHPLFAALRDVPDAGGSAGRVRWNFEKFLLTAAGARRFRSAVEPSDPALIAAIEAALPGGAGA